MATELVTFKLDADFLAEVDKTSKKAGYANRTDFIRNSLREKVDEVKLKEAYKELSKMYGKGRHLKAPTDEEMHIIGEEIAQKYMKKFNIK